MWPSFLEGAAALALVASALALQWPNDTLSMCSWSQFRGKKNLSTVRPCAIETDELGAANIIQDTIYLDGGWLWWQVSVSHGHDCASADN